MAEEIKETEVKGFLKESLLRGNKAIREQRGEVIWEDLEMVYKREVENKQIDLKKIDRRMANAFDFSVTNTHSLIMKREDFDATEVMMEDLQLGLDREKTIDKLNIAKKRYNHLFGHTYEPTAK